VVALLEKNYKTFQALQDASGSKVWYIYLLSLYFFWKHSWFFLLCSFFYMWLILDLRLQGCLSLACPGALNGSNLVKLSCNCSAICLFAFQALRQAILWTFSAWCQVIALWMCWHCL
jgi:hypothetical protein